MFTTGKRPISVVVPLLPRNCLIIKMFGLNPLLEQPEHDCRAGRLHSLPSKMSLVRGTSAMNLSIVFLAVLLVASGSVGVTSNVLAAAAETVVESMSQALGESRPHPNTLPELGTLILLGMGLLVLVAGARRLLRQRR
jgi:hypothetical protein